MTSRRRIEKFCKEKGLKVLNLRYERNRDAAYGDTWDTSYWELELELEGKKEIFHTCGDTEIEESIPNMFEDIIDHIESEKESVKEKENLACT